MKAIQTRWNGCHFRSRLEARWAVFFQFIGLRWEYEPEGFDLGSAGWYLPDFRLSDLNLWYEVKGPTPTEEDLAKIDAFAEQLPAGWCLALAIGDIPSPDRSPYDVHDWWFGSGNIVKYKSEYRKLCSSFPLDGEPEPPAPETCSLLTASDSWHSWCACSSGGHYGIEWMASGCRIECGCPDQNPDSKYGGARGRIPSAYAAARSARFEHGESPSF